MPELVADCPRCGAAKITFDLLSSHQLGERYNWQSLHDAFCVCRHCDRTTGFVLSQSGIHHGDIIRARGLGGLKGSLNKYFKVDGFVSLKDFVPTKSPEHVPPEIRAAFEEGATCMAVGCFNAGATMFRLCIDHATKAIITDHNTAGQDQRIHRSLGHRLRWLFEKKHLPEELRELSFSVKEDGNDGAHAGTLTKEDAEDLVDFTCVLLERLYTEPERLRLARQRRDARRNPTS